MYTLMHNIIYYSIYNMIIDLWSVLYRRDKVDERLHCIIIIMIHKTIFGIGT